ncbi:cilia- and flagella-associated protein 46-like [Cynoglossus semilaevis]|uniref:cilia- and flagella-associated protein 46-like n=1 Tax=Cynoglossus semilaevis TaxID=244447 RepID=UPI000496DAD6|nr:cilia- and flagella-associated protein 46-like [Cynoglossus semilaevis]
MEWLSACGSSGQVALVQLTAVSLSSMDNLEYRARCLCLMGKYLRLQALQEDPIYVCGIWNKNKHEAWPETISVKDENSTEKDSEENGTRSQASSAKRAKMKRRLRAQRLLSLATEALTEGVSLGLQHNMLPSLLAEACMNILACVGPSDPAVTGQYLALFQSCCTVSTAVKVLTSACADTASSQLSALLSLRRNLLLSQKETACSMLKGVEFSLNSISKVFTQMSINPNHLNILSELPPNLKILLLQHSEDGSELYGALYEGNQMSENQKGKTTGALMCSKVVKTSVCPQALLTLREQTRAFGQDTRNALSKKNSVENSEKHQKTDTDGKLTSHFSKIIQDTEEYLHPLLTQFDFSFLRFQAASQAELEISKPKDKVEKGSFNKDKLPVDSGEYLVLLADRKLLDLPLESLLILRGEGVISISRDFSLQLLHSRLNGEELERVESDNKKASRVGKGSKGRADQSQRIKVTPDTPSNTFPVDKQNLKYIIEPHNNSSKSETNMAQRISQMMETHCKELNHLWEEFKGIKQKSLTDLEQLLCKCSAFIYQGNEQFMAKIPPSKLVSLSLCECRLALLFEQAQNNGSAFGQSNCDMHKRPDQLFLEKHSETALLLSLAGVSCVVLNQWPCSLEENLYNMAMILDHLLRAGWTPGQTLHSLRKKNRKDPEKFFDPYREEEEEDDSQKTITPRPTSNLVLYGLPNLIFT